MHSSHDAGSQRSSDGSDPLDETVTEALPSEELPASVGRRAFGSTVSRYVVLDELGRGGMGRVLRAYDPKLEREVALKELHGTLDGEAAARLVVEARAMAKLSHPHVVAIYDA